MALTKSSALHWWSARYGINPRVGGRPVFTRNSAGLFTTQEGEVDTAIVNTPRWDWATLNLPNGQTERRKVLTLELARTNLFQRATEFDNAYWPKVASGAGTVPVVTPNQAIAPDGNLTADKIVFVAPGGSDTSGLESDSAYAITAAAKYAGGFYAKAFAAGDVGKTILFRHAARASFTSIVLTEIWQRVSGVEIAFNTNSYIFLGLAPANGSSTGTVSAFIWLGQHELGPFATSGIQTVASAVGRAADSLYWNFPPVPQAMMGYQRFEEQGSIHVQDSLTFHFGGDGSSNPRFLGFCSLAQYYGTYINNGIQGVSALLAVAPVIGDTVEHVPILFPDASVLIIQSINGAAVTASAQSGAPSGGLPGQWINPRLYQGSAGSLYQGANKFAELKFVKYTDVVASTAQGIMDELRAFELGPNGEVL